MISLVEWWYNTIFHSSLHTTFYEVVYGQPSLIHMPYLPSDSCVDGVDKSLQAQEVAIKLLHFYLHRAANRMKQQANNHRSDRNFELGDLVYVKLQPYRQ